MEFSGDKVAIITGASRGIGAGLVEAYRKHGYRVIANSRTITDSPHPEVVTVAGDIADLTTAERLVIEAVARFGRIDTLVNNAGVFVPKGFTRYAPEDYALVTSVNLGGFFNITQRVIAEMLARGNGGHVVSITTTLVEHAHSGVPSALTALTKGGLAAVTKSLAIEYADRGIRVNAISPGVIDTPLHAGLPEGRDAAATYAGMHPQNRIGAVADIVHGAVYLETAPFVTGEILHVDGGQSAGH
jgi:NAD(P)-dependent dehydrogenase (short-subunit alcohol dehydrogenase family)